MDEIIRIGLDTSKSVFQVHGVNAAERPVLRKTLRRADVERFFAALAPALIGLEACGASHHWARVLRGLGHEVRLLPPQYVKPYVKRGKNDAADAEAICEAMSRPGMRFVSVRTAENQGELMLHGARELLIKQRTMLVNAIRGHAAEFGVTGAKGLSLTETFRRLRACGFEGVEPNLAHVTDPDAWVAASKESGLIIDGTVGARTEKLDDGIALTRKLGGDSMLVVARYDQKVPLTENWNRCRDQLKAAAPEAERQRIKLLVENVWATFLISPFDMVRFKIGRAHV